MNFVRTRLILLTITAMLLVGVLGTMGTRSFLDLQAAEDGLRLSYWLEEQSPNINALTANSEDWESFKGLIEGLSPDQRKAAWARVISVKEQKYDHLLRDRLQFALETEREYRRFQSQQIPFLRYQVQFYFVILFFGVLGGIVLNFLYVQFAIFRPLKNLSKKMYDFLHDRYTYQFSVPPPNELGHLQATFNALAQRVLSNMEELKNLDHAKSEFLNIASHELRTPLTSIKGSLSILKSGIVGTVNETVANLLQIAEVETDRLIRLINELLDLAKIEAGRFEVHAEWHPIKELIESTFQSLQGLSQAAQVKLIAKDVPYIETRVDRDRIQQVLTNLISNAIKFSPMGGQVEIEVDAQPDGLWIKVLDHGRGIAPEDQELIFQKFRQATSTRNPLVKGTGLGLSIAKALVEEHGGKMGLSSKPGEGSIFYFTLPEWKYALNKIDRNGSVGVAA